MRAKTIVGLLLLALPASLACVPPRSGALRRADDAPGPSHGERMALTQAADPAVRAQALWALGRAQDSAAVEWVLPALADPEARVRAEAAFAAGLLAQAWDPLPEFQRDALARGLLEAEAREADPEARARMLEALGKTSAPPALDRLGERLADADAAVRAKAAVSLGVAARRGAKLDDRAVQAALPLLAGSQPVAVRYGAAYALAFSKRPSARAGLVSCLEDAEAETRALCARGLGEVAQPPDAAALGKHLDDPDARVAAEATRALARMAERCDAPECGPLEALRNLTPRVALVERGESSAGVPPLLALAQQGLPEKGRAVLKQLRAAILEALARTPRSVDLSWLDCRYAAALDRLDGALARTPACGVGVADERRISLGLREVARGLGEASSPEAVWAPWLQYLSHPSAQVRSAALEALSAAKAQSAAPKIRALIADPDATVAANAVYASAALKDADAFAPALALLDRIPEVEDRAALAESLVELARAVPAAKAERQGQLEPVLRRWLVSPEPSVRTSAAAALAKLTGRPIRPPFIDRAPPAPEPAPAGEAALAFTTDKGAFKIRLDLRETPRTSQNLLALAARGYFDGLTFHRVVPDFVVQGGDPRGDGEGGPGYRIRCEIGHAPYTRGSVGMALSGRDTGGSQFFVALSAQPHLDGRYTRFGEVVEGMDVVDRLDEGDVMRTVRAVRP